MMTEEQVQAWIDELTDESAHLGERNDPTGMFRMSAATKLSVLRQVIR